MSLSQLGWNRHSTTMLADEHTTAKSRRPLCIISKASSYHEKTSCKPLESEKLSFRCSQVKAPLTTGVATPHGAAMPAVKKAGTPGLPCRHRLALFASHLPTRQTTGARLVTLCLFLTSQRHFQLKMVSSITLLCCHAKSKQHEAPSLPQSFGLHAQLGTKESIIALELPSQCLSHKWWTCTCSRTSVAAHRLLLQLSALQLTCRLTTHTTCHTTSHLPSIVQSIPPSILPHKPHFT